MARLFLYIVHARTRPFAVPVLILREPAFRIRVGPGNQRC